jgi:hypothetical protein
MGIDYDSIGGIGIELTGERIDLIIKKGLFTEDEWIEDSYECAEKIGLTYGVGGDGYSGDITYYLLVEGNKLKDIYENAEKFVERLNEIGIEMLVDDLEVIDDLHVY